MHDRSIEGLRQLGRHQRRPMDSARLRISRLSVARRGLAPVLREICSIAGEILDVERVGVWLFLEDRSAIRCVCLKERSTDRFSEGVVLRVADFPSYFESLTVRRTLPAEHATVDPRSSELRERYLDPLGITSILDAPILLQEEVHGVVCHEHVGPPREWTTEERDFAASVADLVALKINAAEVESLNRALRGLESDSEGKRRQACLARMAGGIAHDFRNLLAIIQGFAEEIRSGTEAPADWANHAGQIVQTVKRGLALTDRLVDISRDQARRPTVLDPGEHLEGFVAALRQTVGERHSLEFARGPRVGRVFLDPTELERVVLNLVINARDAMAEGGPIQLSVTAEDWVEAGAVRIEVADRGHGIEPAILDRIFDPYFSTKPRDRGTGLGLAIVKEIVERAGGRLQVRSRPGEGTAMLVSLPRVAHR